MPQEIMALFATAAATFQPIKGQPSNDDLTAMQDILYPLLLEIPYNDQPGGMHNLIGIVEPVASYQNHWGVQFPIPACPLAYPAVPNDATAVVQACSKAEHIILVRDFTSYKAAECAIAKFIHDAVDEIWYRNLGHARSYYTNVMAKQLMDHLNTNCGGLHPSELVSLPNKMMRYHTKAEGIWEYINMLEETQCKLACVNLPMSDD